MVGDERRKHQRRPVRYPAWISSGTEIHADCVLADISEGGARIKVKEEVGVPDHFILLFNPQGTPKRPCRVVWRREGHLGLQFESSSAAADATGRSIFEV